MMGEPGTKQSANALRTLAVRLRILRMLSAKHRASQGANVEACYVHTSHSSKRCPSDFSNQERSLSMSNIEKSIDVNVPVHVAYNQWTQFEEFRGLWKGNRKYNNSE